MALLSTFVGMYFITEKGIYMTGLITLGIMIIYTFKKLLEKDESEEKARTFNFLVSVVSLISGVNLMLCFKVRFYLRYCGQRAT